MVIDGTVLNIDREAFSTPCGPRMANISRAVSIFCTMPSTCERSQRSRGEVVSCRGVATDPGAWSMRPSPAYSP